MNKAVRGRHLAIVLAFGTLSAVAANNFGVVSGYGLLDTSTNAAFSEVTLAGTVYKHGSGDLTLNDPLAADAVLVADTGSVRVVMSASAAEDVSLGGIRLGKTSAFEVDVAQDKAFSIGSLRLEQVGIKTGAGTLLLGADALGAGLLVRGGSIGMSGHLREDLPFAAPGGCEIDVSEDGVDGVVSCSPGESSGVLRKTGNGALTLCGAIGSVEGLEVSEGALRLQPDIVSVRQGGEMVAVANASFEEGPRPSGDSTYNTSTPANWSAERKLEGWNGTVGLTLAGSPWVSESESSIPDGDLAAFIQADARLYQTIRLPKRGRYRISVWMASRYESATVPHEVEIALGGSVLTNVVSKKAKPALVVVETAVMEAGDAVLSFTGKYAALTRTPSTVVDDIKVSLAESVLEGDAVVSPAADLLGERDFEDALEEIGEQQWISVTPGNSREIGGWTFESRVEKDNCGPNVSKIIPGAARGKVNAMIQNRACVSRAIDLPERGVYSVTFLAAARQNYPGHRFRVKWNGRSLGMVETPSVAYRACTFQIVATHAHEQGILSFEGEGGAELTSSSVLDCVQVRRLPEFDLADGPVLDAGLSVEMAAGTSLDLAFDGTNTVKSFRANGRSYTGVIGASRFPELISGKGCLYVRPLGFLLILR